MDSKNTSMQVDLQRSYQEESNQRRVNFCDTTRVVYYRAEDASLDLQRLTILADGSVDYERTRLAPIQRLRESFLSIRRRITNRPAFIRMYHSLERCVGLVMLIITLIIMGGVYTFVMYQFYDPHHASNA
ncbi:uncharacterized protein LOC132695878 [Cylas formicarius]|uniref:uncharacterized protein LOC132695878 n=1 Tax=Cylas formicarius TaxID=197179 RepID=UPI0029584307|nr:uncharacterized protein LOC132695878 [Cylas formicarius]